MQDTLRSKFSSVDAGTLFCIGWVLLFSAQLFPLPSVGDTFMYGWRVDLVSSVLLLVALGSYLIFQRDFQVNDLEIRAPDIIVVIPVVLFILWSGISVLWSNTRSAAIHHTLVWSVYLTFFLIVRHLLSIERNYTKLITTLSICLTCFATLAISSYITQTIFAAGPSLGIIYMKYGEQINALFPLLLIGVIGLRGRSFLGGALVLTLLWLLVFASLSRTNLFLFVGCIIAVGVLVLAHRRLRRYKLKFALLVVIFLAAPFSLHIVSIFSSSGSSPIANRVGETNVLTSSNNFRLLMLSLSAEMIRARPFTGVGADNFGFEVNRFRSAYSDKYPMDPKLAEAESNIPERAHNEFAQIAAELGLFGILIFSSLLAAIAFLAFRAVRNFNKTSPYAFAALIGTAIFLASSLVTSYSFRLMQNGFVFFFLLAVLLKTVRGNKRTEQSSISAINILGRKPLLIFGVIACIGLAGLSFVRAYSSAQMIRGNRAANIDEAAEYYRGAIWLDGTNAGASYYFGIRLIEEKRYAEAVPLIQSSIELGRARSSDLSYLATAQSLAGDDVGAEKTFEYAVSLYPRSPFVLTRYSALLKANGDLEKAEAYFRRASEIDAPSANSWRLLIDQGAKAVSDKAAVDKEFVPVMDLYPSESLYAVIAERDIRFPDERTKFPWEKLSNMGN